MFNAIARPFGMLLMFLYNVVDNYVLALFLIAVIMKVVLLPFQMKGKRGMMRQTRLQPKIAELQKRHSANKQKLNEEMAKLYKEEGVNPASGCLWNFIQMPIMIALFFAIRQPLTNMMGVARELLEEGGSIHQKLTEMGFDFSISRPGMEQIDQAQFITEHFNIFAPLSEHLQRISFNLGNINFAETPQFQLWEFPWNDASALFPMLILFTLPILSGAAQFVSASIMRKMNAAGTPDAAGTMGKVLKFMPLMSVWFGFMLPAALSFYWTIGTVLQIVQDIWLTKKYTKILDEEDAEKAIIRQAKEADIETKRLETERKKAEGIVEQNVNISKRKKKKSVKQDKIEKAAEWEKKNAPPKTIEEKNEPGRVGNRRYARGRAYDPERYANVSDDTDDETEKIINDVEIIGDDSDETSSDAYEYAAEDAGYIDVEYTEVSDDDDEDDDDESDNEDDDFEDDDDSDEDDDDSDEDEDEDFEDDDYKDDDSDDSDDEDDDDDDGDDSDEDDDDSDDDKQQ